MAFAGIGAQTAEQRNIERIRRARQEHIESTAPGMHERASRQDPVRTRGSYDRPSSAPPRSRPFLAAGQGQSRREALQQRAIEEARR